MDRWCLKPAIVLGLGVWLCCWVSALAVEPNAAPTHGALAEAAVVTVKGFIDDGLYQSVRRRTEEAIGQGASYIIYDVSTYGGAVDAADNICKYLILDVAPRAHTVAYISTEAISAGAMISVSCQDILMHAHTTIGACAPISMGEKLEGVEREKTESFIRAIFDRAAEANHYPRALLRAMVTVQVEVYKVRNKATGEEEFFEAADLPKDPNAYDLAGKTVVDSQDRLLTVSAGTAKEYGIARAVVSDLKEALDFLARRDGVTFEGTAAILETNWSEQMVRALNHPAVTGILLLIGLMGLYMEFNAPGLGLPGLAAAICFTVLFGSKYLIGMANWIEVAVFIAGVILLLVEFFVLPGFGIAGVLGIVFMAGGLLASLVRNPPTRLPWPDSQLAWDSFYGGVLGMAGGVVGFVVLAWVLGKYLPKLGPFSGLVLTPSPVSGTQVRQVSGHGKGGDLRVGLVGTAETPLRPSGKARFGQVLVDCVAQAEFVESGHAVEVVEIHGNRVVVRPFGHGPSGGAET